MTRTTIERLTLRLRGKPSVRRWLKSPTAKRLRRSWAGAAADSWILRQRAQARSAELLDSFQDVATACLFIGHVKSGGSLVGAMLDAHPSIVMGDEVDVARLMRAGISGEAMLFEFARSARREAIKGRVTARRLGGYSLAIEGRSQGIADRANVVGNSRPGPTTRYLAKSGALTEVVSKFETRRLLFLQVIRKPEDSVAAMVLRSGRDIVEAARDHAEQCERLTDLRRRLGDSVYPIRYEALLDDCETTLEGVTSFLGVDVLDGYLAACSGLVDGGRVPESSQVSWNTAALDVIDASIHAHDFLEPYRD